jgi:hypothetical protein
MMCIHFSTSIDYLIKADAVIRVHDVTMHVQTIVGNGIIIVPPHDFVHVMLLLPVKGNYNDFGLISNAKFHENQSSHS